jgi:hypothetical protein
VQYFVPDIRLTAELPPQFNLEEKLGGIPWGLPPDRWPACADCGKPQTLLAQFVHHPMRLDLNREGRCLFVFHCTQNPGMCDSWRGGGGANACFVIEPEDLLSALTPPPAKAATPEREARIVQWQEREDGVTAEQGAFFFDDERRLDLDEAVREELFPKASCQRVWEAFLTGFRAQVRLLAKAGVLLGSSTVFTTSWWHPLRVPRASTSRESTRTTRCRATRARGLSSGTRESVTFS